MHRQNNSQKGRSHVRKMHNKLPKVKFPDDEQGHSSLANSPFYWFIYAYFYRLTH